MLAIPLPPTNPAVPVPGSTVGVVIAVVLLAIVAVAMIAAVIMVRPAKQAPAIETKAELPEPRAA